MADKIKLQDQQIARNEKLARSTEPFNTTIQRLLDSESNQKRLEKRRILSEEQKNGQRFVGGYVLSQIDAIEAIDKTKRQPTETELHTLIQTVFDSFPATEISKQDAKAYKNWSLTLLETPERSLYLTITKITTVSMICEVKHIYQKQYFRFASEEDKTVVQDFKMEEAILKYSAKLSSPRRTMSRIVDSMICKYRIKDNAKIDGGWNDLLN